MTTLLLAAAMSSAAAYPAPRAKKANPAELFRQAVEAADSYRFDEAAELLERYGDALPRRGKAPVAAEEVEALTARVERGRLMMERVEKIVVIDSISVPKEKFFEAYRLDPSAGTLRDAETLGLDVEAMAGQPVYMPESRQSIIWAMPDTAGHGVIAEVSVLADGSHEPVVTYPSLSVATTDGAQGVNALYPFLMADGVTLYYAMDNPELSLGGLDIFFTRRDGDGFMHPQNIGMPYNSPANDYLLAIDEASGTGWWATDRHHPGSDSVTIYRFIPNELRVNYNQEETPDLASLARLDSWRDTQPEGADYSDYLARPIATGKDAPAPEISIAIPGRGTVTAIADLRSPRARQLAREWADTGAELEKVDGRLRALRLQYRQGKTSTSTEILSLERRQTALRSTLVNMRNDIINAELRDNNSLR